MIRPTYTVDLGSVFTIAFAVIGVLAFALKTRTDALSQPPAPLVPTRGWPPRARQKGAQHSPRAWLFATDHAGPR